MTAKALRSIGVVTLVVAFACLPGSASAGEVPDNLTTTSPGFASDNDRYFSYVPTGEGPVIVDTFRGTTVSVKGADGCNPTDAYDGRFLLNCVVKTVGPDDVNQTLLASAETGRTVRLERPSLRSYHTLGRYWAMGDSGCVGTGSHCSATIYRNLRTGKGRGFPVGYDRPDERNVDQKGLFAAPNHPRFRLGRRENQVLWNRKVLITDDGSHLKLWRKGKKVVNIGESIGFEDGNTSLEGVELGGGQFAWFDRVGALRSVELNSLKRHKLPRSGYVSPVSGIFFGNTEMSPIRGGLITITGNATGVDVPDTEYEIQIVRYR